LVLPALVQDYRSTGINSTSSSSSSSIDQQAVCKLLCCSKAISSDVHAECSGQLSALYCARSLQQSQWFAAWLARNARLLQQLQLSFHNQWQNGAVGSAFSASVPVAIAGALNIAAVRGSLQHLHTWVDHMPSAAVLNALAGFSSLTKLELDFSAVSGWYGTVNTGRRNDRDESDSESNVIRIDNSFEPDGHEFAQMYSALAGLKQLRQLSLRWSTPMASSNGGVFNPLWPVLHHLSQLTALTTTYTTPFHIQQQYMVRVHAYLDLDLAQHLPLSLAKLVLLPTSYFEDDMLGRVLLRREVPYFGDMAHLTSLTELRAPTAAMGAPDVEQWGHDYWFRVTDDDEVRVVLPASLEMLLLGRVEPVHMQHLLQLPKLHTLAIESAVELTCELLQQLQEIDIAHEGSLTNLQLRYRARECPAHGPEDAIHNGDNMHDVMKCHASHWPVLPLRRVSIDGLVYHRGEQWNSNKMRLDRFNAGPLSADVLSHVVKLTGLTYLGLMCDLPRDFGASQGLAGTLAGTWLQQERV
jgi:hypothetical protein